MTLARKKLGIRGEAAAKNYLQHRGYSFVVANWRHQRQEIDLVFKNNDQTIFIEVKTRRVNFASQLDVPLGAKQIANLKKAILAYCFKNRLAAEKTRLDLILILLAEKNEQAVLKHYRNILQ